MKKVYKRLFHRSVNAVNDVTFAVKAGECFGVLGPSGSGKTTTFKMLTDEIVPSEGNSWILNFKLRENKAEVSLRYYHLFYCQFKLSANFIVYSIL